jgi:hypothetical protein
LHVLELDISSFPLDGKLEERERDKVTDSNRRLALGASTSFKTGEDVEAHPGEVTLTVCKASENRYSREDFEKIIKAMC